MPSRRSSPTSPRRTVPMSDAAGAEQSDPSGTSRSTSGTTAAAASEWPSESRRIPTPSASRTTDYHVIYERCVCNQRITSYPFYGMWSPEQDEDEITYFDRTHDRCMAEWGLGTYPDDPLGVRHCPDFGPVEPWTGDEDIRAS